MPEVLRDKRILWGSIFMVCITLGLLLIQPVSVMLAESSMKVVQPSGSSLISPKQLQSSFTPTTRDAVEVSSTQYTNDTLASTDDAIPEPTATPQPVYAIPFATRVAVTPTPSPTPMVNTSPTPLPASPTPSIPSSVTPIVTASPGPALPAASTITAKPTVRPVK